MIPFRVQLHPGTPITDQVVYAAKKAIIAGKLRPGSAFPSVRALSKDLKIHPNTAHKVVTELVAEGLLEVVPGIGTLVAEPRHGTTSERRSLLGPEIEHLVVEAKKVGLSLDHILDAVTRHWDALEDRQQQLESIEP